ncbi:tRNA pseudouridine(38-40) synthase TruA [candidate division KSB1 bacterium]
MEHRYFIKIAYHGKNYHGWQVQENASTVQLVLDNALSTILSSKVQTTGAGRTDTGVHAREFYAHFDFHDNLNDNQCEQLIFNLNSYLPNDISIYKILKVKSDAHARFHAISRTYEYWISKIKDPFQEAFSYYYHGKLDIDVMNEGASLLKNYDDFSSFSKSGTQVKTNICQVKEAYWERKEEMIAFTITADRFLRNMVRAIVGTLIDLGRGHINMDQLKLIIESKNRSEAGLSVPAKGLFLTKIEYPEEIFI